MEKLEQFLIKVKENELLKIYLEDSQEIHELLDNIYSCAFRFNLTNKQTIYLLNKALDPFLGTWVEVNKKGKEA